MKALFLNSDKKEITEIEINLDSFHDAYKKIGNNCDTIEQLSHVFDNGDTLLFDEEGRLKSKGLGKNNGFFLHSRRGYFEIYGNAILVNTADFMKEDYDEPKSSIETLQDKIKFECF